MSATNRSDAPRARRSGLSRHVVSIGALALYACAQDEAPRAITDAGISIDTDAAPPEADAGAQVPEAERVCSSDAWCWDGAGPHGNTLNAVAGPSADALWLVGDLGLALELTGDTWAPRWAPTREHLRALSVRGGEVWAVGDASTVLHYVNQSWQAEAAELLDTPTDLRGVATNAGGDVFVVGARGTVLERSGGAWSVATVPITTALNAVVTIGASAWAVGDGGAVLRRSDGAWSAIESGTAQNLRAIHGSGGDIWIAGESGEVRRFDSEASRFERPQGEGPAPTGSLRAVQVSRERVFVASSQGAVHVWDESLTCPVPGDAGAPEQPCPGWAPVRSTGSERPILGLWARDDRVVTVGELGSIVSFEGARRTVIAAGSLDNYLGLSGTSNGEIWVAGDRLLRRTAAGWLRVEQDSPRAVYAVQALDSGQALVAGTGGMSRRLAGDGWESLDVAPDAWLHGLTSDGESGWLVGSRGRSWGLLNRRLWTELDTPTERDLLAVWSAPLGNVWAVGAGGTILRHDGAIWAAIPSGPNGGVSADLRGVWGSSDDDIWAVGTAGTALHWDGTRWLPTTEPDSFSLNDVWGRSARDVWAVGSGGTILHYDGTAWQPQLSGTSQALHGVWGNAEHVWVAGERGVILIKDAAGSVSGF